MSNETKKGIFETLYESIEEILQELKDKGVIKETHQSPTDNFKGYPAIVYFPAEMNNAFFTTGDNFREYKFRLFILVGIDQTTMDFAFKQVLANVSDKLIQAFDSNWKISRINGHRVWIRLDTGTWGVDKIDKGLVSVAEFNLIIKLAVDN